MTDFYSEGADVIVIGAGQNGLIAANYLKRAGLSVIVLERRLESGGGLSGEEPTINGFWHVTGNAFQDLDPILPFMSDLQLAKFNGRWIRPDVQSALVRTDGRALVIHAALDRTLQSIGIFSQSDAERWRYIVDIFQSSLPALRRAPTMPPGENGRAELDRTPLGRELARIQQKTSGDVVDEYFESETVQAMVVMHLAVPRGVGIDYANTSPLVPLAIGLAAENRLAAGGVHELAQALWTACIRGDGDVWDSTTATKILVENGRAAGVEIDGGRRIRARAVISSLDLESTFLDLVGEDLIPSPFAQRVRSNNHRGVSDLMWYKDLELERMGQQYIRLPVSTIRPRHRPAALPRSCGRSRPGGWRPKKVGQSGGTPHATSSWTARSTSGRATRPT